MLIIFYEKILFKQHVIIFHKWFGRVKILGFGSVFSFSFINNGHKCHQTDFKTRQS